MSLDDGNSTCTMGLFGIRPEEIIGSLESIVLFLHLSILLHTGGSALRRLGDGRRGGGRGHVVCVASLAGRRSFCVSGSQLGEIGGGDRTEGEGKRKRRGGKKAAIRTP